MRSSSLTMRASVPGRPEVSPTIPTRSPTTMSVRPSSRARIQTVGAWPAGASSSTTPQRPRSLVTTMPYCALLWAGRSLVRGREPFPGRIFTSDSSQSRCARLAMRHQLCPHVRKVGECFGGGGYVFDLNSGDGESDDGTGGGHAMVRVGVPKAAVQLFAGDR